MAQRFYEPIARIFTNAGAVGVGYKYYFYQTGTTTPVTTYQDDALTIANTNPVISDSNGRFPEIWYSDLSQLKLVVKDSSDNTIETVDPVGATASAVSLNDFNVRPTSYWGLTAGTSTAYTLVANPTISAYANTQTFIVQPHVDCGDSPTLAIDGLSALNWKKYTQQGTKVAMKANDLRASQRYFCINDGVDIVCLNPSSLPILSGSATSLTIATGAVTLTNNSSSYTINTEGAAASDDLDTINGGQDGQIIFIRSANSSRDINITTSGNILPFGGVTNYIRDTNTLYGLRYDSSLAKWIAIFSNYFTCTNGTSGYQFLPNGLILQWGTTQTLNPGTNNTITLPLTFPNAILNVQTAISEIPSPNNGSLPVYTRTRTTSNFVAVNQDPDSAIVCMWFAIGY